MANKETGFDRHSKFFSLSVTLPTEKDVEEIFKQVCEELKDIHPSSLTGSSVLMDETVRRLSKKIIASLTVNSEYADVLMASKR